MKICVIGTGYVGLVSGTCLAEMGNDVICVDNNPEKVTALKQGHVPIYEPGLEELILFNTQEDRLVFTTDLDAAVREATLCFIAVGTPQNEEGAADLSAVFAVAKAIGQTLAKAEAEGDTSFKVVVNKSTVPVGTGHNVQTILAEAMGPGSKRPFAVVSNPEFLKQGAAVEDFLKPDRVVIGADEPKAAELMQELYSPFLRTGNPILLMDIRSAEMTKYVANAFLATKISFINEMSNLCEALGADIERVRNGVATDKRIGSQFLFPGVGYGGSCFPKDVKALMYTAQDSGCPSGILAQVDAANQRQRQQFLLKVTELLGEDLNGKTLAVWGLAFKPRTDDMREAPSVTIIEELLRRGAVVRGFDPKAMQTAKGYFGERITYAENAYDACKNADALLLLTEWNEFRRPNFERLKDLLKAPVIIDGRNQYEAERMAKRGFTYRSMGRPHFEPALENELVGV